MPVAVNAGEWLVEIDQVSRSHVVSTLVHLNAQPEPKPVQKRGAGNWLVLDHTCRSLTRLAQLR